MEQLSRPHRSLLTSAFLSSHEGQREARCGHKDDMQQYFDLPKLNDTVTLNHMEQITSEISIIWVLNSDNVECISFNPIYNF